MQIAEIKEKKQDGDMQTAARIVGITPANARQAFKRPDSKHHSAVVSALETLIITREILIEQGA
ncbi:hypothetical protein BDD43_3433 [Mucilaginibacter gracilis]|uniref:Uncharacterized protein n=1 Tax=Mucilaginibacter gracilis TaxID=423350 RepID=A0A495J2N1_9SPHI|nr:hypothetical protein [Mucilaginibacter gracilis]RKR83230.1 hypothetical protein BDD43_3433 [Mucilaginibacter gracilis]